MIFFWIICITSWEHVSVCFSSPGMHSICWMCVHLFVWCVFLYKCVCFFMCKYINVRVFFMYVRLCKCFFVFTICVWSRMSEVCVCVCVFVCIVCTHTHTHMYIYIYYIYINMIQTHSSVFVCVLFVNVCVCCAISCRMDLPLCTVTHPNWYLIFTRIDWLIGFVSARGSEGPELQGFTRRPTPKFKRFRYNSGIRFRDFVI